MHPLLISYRVLETLHMYIDQKTNQKLYNTVASTCMKFLEKKTIKRNYRCPEGHVDGTNKLNNTAGQMFH